MWSALRTLLRARRPAGPAAELLAWGRRQGLAARPMSSGDGWGLVGALDEVPLMIEWGPAPNGEMQGPVLRFRLDAGLPPRLQMLLLSRHLAERLEREAYARLTAQQQTRLDPGLSEPMRWLAMYPPLTLPVMRPLRDRFRAVAPTPWTVNGWLEGDLAEALDASKAWLPATQALQLMTLRGRIELRLEASGNLSPEFLDRVCALLQRALQRARWVATEPALPPGIRSR